MHRRQFLPDNRTSYYDILKWRSHHAKFEAFMVEMTGAAKKRSRKVA